MKKFILATGIATLAFVSVAAAQSTTFTSNLTVGSSGAEVVALQSWLIANGFNIPAISAGTTAKGYFGSQTAAAVKLYQASRGIPNTGYVGPLTRAALNGGATVGSGACPAGLVCTPVTPVSVTCPTGFVCTPVGGGSPIPSTGGLSGTDGTITDVNELSQYSSEEVGDGQNDVKVLGFEVEASNDGDIRIKSVKISFDATGNSGSDNLDDYIEGVSVWMGSTKVGSADVSGFNEDSSNVWSRTISLSGNTIVKADDAESFYVSVDSVNNLDSGDISGDSWTVNVDSIRFEDGSGVTTTDSTTGDLPSFDVPIAFVSYSTAADTSLKFSTDSSSPDAAIVMVDENDTTDDVLLLVGKIKLEGTSDVTIDELPITFTAGNVSTGATGLASTTASVKLVIGSEEYSESVTSAYNTAVSTVTFDNLDFTVDAGSTVTFKIYADILSTDGALTAGDILKASFTETNRIMIDAENSENDQLTSSEKTGTVNGEYQEFRVNGIGLTLISTATDATTGTSSNDDIGLFTIKFKVTAFGDNIYVSSLTTTAGLTYVVDKSGTATSSNSISASLVNNDDATLTSVGNYLIEDGDSEDFTLSVSVPLGTGGTSGQYRAALTAFKWDTNDDTSMDNSYTSDMDAFKTAYKVLN